MGRVAWIVCVVAVAASVAVAEQPPRRLLCVSVTTGFRHASIPVAEAALEEIGRESSLFHLDWLRQPPGRPQPPKPPQRGPETTAEEWQTRQEEFRTARQAFERDEAAWQSGLRERLATAFSPATLAAFDGVIFASTTGDLPIPDMDAFLAWIASGKAFVGFHAATDTFKGSDAFVAMIGGYFAGHPWRAGGEHGFVVHEPGHRIAAMLPARFRWQDEIYQYDDRYVPENVRVLVSLDMTASDPREPWHVPVSWIREYGKGRVFSTNFGHNEATWREPMFRRHAAEGIAWALGLVDAPAEPNPDVQAAEFVRSVVAAAAATTEGNADELLAAADARMAADPGWAAGQRPKLAGLRDLKPEARAPAYAEFVADLLKH